ncbi:MAG: hypothetical protein SXV54_26450 [Chloroflexota bacterium]|nr:hypothetical protein [Chloroflexota bacterium]
MHLPQNRETECGLQRESCSSFNAPAWPAWSPDNTRIAFVSDRDGNLEIYVMNADGSGQVNLTNSPAHDTSPAWQPQP